MELSIRVDARGDSNLGSTNWVEHLNDHFRGSKSHAQMSTYIDGKDDMDSFLLRFERQAHLYNWSDRDQALHLSNLLTGKALDTCPIPPVEALSFIKLKEALLNKYQLHADGFKTRFQSAKFDMGERLTQYIYRIEGLWNKWLESA